VIDGVVEGKSPFERNSEEAVGSLSGIAGTPTEPSSDTPVSCEVITTASPPLWLAVVVVAIVVANVLSFPGAVDPAAACPSASAPEGWAAPFPL
jgi:hypothetical protein